ncbi:hypothetical protein QL285_049713 [Trifolium repens]|nr:hypothetical protein QL285_049713 [Trifolium repens]
MLVSRSEYSLLQLFTTLQELESTILVLGAVQGLTYLLVGLDIQDLEPPMFSSVQVHLKRCAILTSQELNNCSKL